MAKNAKNQPTFWNDTLPAEARIIVDKYLSRIAVLSWRQRCDAIEAALISSAINRDKQSRAARESAQLLTSSIVAAIIERLDATTIVESDQARLFAMSASLDHQAAAYDWFVGAGASSILSSALPSSPAGMPLH
jgi:hypothetical protein